MVGPRYSSLSLVIVDPHDFFIFKGGGKCNVLNLQPEVDKLHCSYPIAPYKDLRGVPRNGCEELICIAAPDTKTFKVTSSVFEFW